MFRPILDYTAERLYRSHANELLPETLCAFENYEKLKKKREAYQQRSQDEEEGEILSGGSDNESNTGSVCSTEELVANLFPEAFFSWGWSKRFYSGGLIDDEDKAKMLVLKNCRNSNMFASIVLQTLLNITGGVFIDPVLFKVVPEMVHTQEMSLEAFSWCVERMKTDKRASTLIVGMRALTLLVERGSFMTSECLAFLQKIVNDDDRMPVQIEAFRLISRILTDNVTTYTFIQIDKLVTFLKENIRGKRLGKECSQILIAGIKSETTHESHLSKYWDIFSTWCTDCDDLYLLPFGVVVAQLCSRTKEGEAANSNRKMLTLNFLAIILARLLRGSKQHYEQIIVIFQNIGPLETEIDQLHGVVAEKLVSTICSLDDSKDTMFYCRILAEVSKYGPLAVYKNMPRLIDTLSAATELGNTYIVVAYLRSHFLSGFQIDRKQFAVISGKWIHRMDPIWTYKISILLGRHGFPELALSSVNLLRNQLLILRRSLIQSTSLKALEMLSRMNFEIVQMCGRFTGNQDHDFNMLSTLEQKLCMFSQQLQRCTLSLKETKYRKLLQWKAKFWLTLSQYKMSPGVYQLSPLHLLFSELIQVSTGRHRKFFTYLLIVNRDVADILDNCSLLERNTLPLPEILCLIRLEALTNN